MKQQIKQLMAWVCLLFFLTGPTLAQEADKERGKDKPQQEKAAKDAPERIAEIRLGMSTALTGPCGEIGRAFKAGLESVLAEINQAGGIQGKSVTLIAYDDGYEPDACAENMRKLISEDQVLAIVGNFGTPTAIVSVPIVTEQKVLLFAPVSGGDVLRKSPPDRYVINYRASYAQEMAAIVSRLLESGVKPEKIALFSQNDGFGDAAYKGLLKALADRGYTAGEKLAHGRYSRNTANVEDGLATLVNAQPEAVIMAGTYGACAEFVKMGRELMPETIYAALSEVGAIPFAQAAGKAGEGVIVAQVVPLPEGTLPLAQAFLRSISSPSDVNQGFIAFEGYIAGRILKKGLEKAEALDRESIVDGLESLSNADIGLKTPVTYSRIDHQASDQVYLTVLKNGKFVPFK